MFYSRSKHFLRLCAFAVGYSVVASGQTTVRVDARIRFQTIQGFGASERVFDDPHVFDNFNPVTGRSLTVLTATEEDQILDRLYRDLKLTWVRPTTEANVEPVNDNEDPEVTDLSKFNFAWKRNDAHVAYIQRASVRGVTDFFLSPIVREAWMGVSTTRDVAEYTEWSMAVLRRWRELGVEPPYYSLANEPGGDGNPMSGEFMRDVIKRMGPRLRVEGFRTRFVVSDDINPGQAYNHCSVILADPLARSYVGALATHLYEEPITALLPLKQLAEQYNLPLWMTEYTRGEPGIGALDYAEHFLHPLLADYNVSVHLYLWGFFGQWSPSGFQLITLKYDGAKYQGYELDKMYYVLGQYSRFIAPGSVRVKAESNQEAVKATAFAKDGGIVIVAINNTDAPAGTQFSVTGADGISRVDRFRTSEGENGAVLSPVVVTGNVFSDLLPARSITTYIGSPASALSIRNGASYETGAISPCEIVTVFGSSLGPSAGIVGLVDADGRLGTSLGGTRLLIDGTPAPLLFAGAGQVNAIVPVEATGKSNVSILVERQGLRIEETIVPVVQASPAIFSQDGSGRGAGAVLNQDGSLNSESRPASLGSIVSIYATGGGQTDPPTETGRLLSDSTVSRLRLSVSVRIAGQDAEVLYAGAAPGYIGVVQINVRVPGDITPSGSVALEVSIGERESQTGITISVR